MKCFLNIEKIWENKKYLYIGDNLKKDFIAPNKLHWTSIGANWIHPRIHNYDHRDFPVENKPKFWLNKPHELLDSLINKI